MSKRLKDAVAEYVRIMGIKVSSDGKIEVGVKEEESCSSIKSEAEQIKVNCDAAWDMQSRMAGIGNIAGALRAGESK